MNEHGSNHPGASTRPPTEAASGCACSPDGGGCGSSSVDGNAVGTADRRSSGVAAATLGTLVVRVQRYRPDRDQTPYLQDFDVPWSQDTSVLDALNWIKEDLDPTLAFRWSCRMAICGSCGFMLNGVPKLGCEQFVRDYVPGPLRIEPLENLAVERDLVVDLEPFMVSLSAVKPYVIADLPNLLSGPGNLQTPEQMLAYSDYSMCINCMLCYSACPQVALATDFLGPATITAAVRYNHDSRDHGEQQRLPLLDTENGLWSCTFVGECSAVCPKGVDPAAAIQQAKASAALSWVAEFALPYQGTDR